jgi:hypothetical protein
MLEAKAEKERSVAKLGTLATPFLTLRSVCKQQGQTTMNYDRRQADTEARYAAAYDAHYSQRDLRLALHRYKELIELSPTGRTADYSRMQVENIASAVVSKQLMFESHLALLCAHFEKTSEKDSASQNALPVAAPAAV